MDNFDPYNVLLAIATNIPVLSRHLSFVVQGHICLCSPLQSLAQDLPGVPHVSDAEWRRPGTEGAGPPQSCECSSVSASSSCVWLDLTPFLCLCVAGDAEAPGLSAARQLSAPAVQRPMWGGGQVPAHLHPPEARPGSREVARIRQRCGALLPAQAVSGAVQHPCLCPELWAARSLQVREESRNQ